MRAWRSYAQTPPPSQEGMGANAGAYWGSAMTPMVKRMLIACCVLEVLAMLGARGFLVTWLGLTPDRAHLQPWGLVTYAFVHGGMGHLLVNMLALFFFGPPLERRWGGRAFAWFAVAAAFGGALLSFTQPESTVVGVSGVGYGILLAFAVLWPDARIFVMLLFPIKAKWVAAGMFVMTLLNAQAGANDGVAHWAHLGGLVAAAAALRLTSLGAGSFLGGRKPRPGRVGPASRTGPRPRAGRGGGGWTVGGGDGSGANRPGRRGGGRIWNVPFTSSDDDLHNRVDAVLDKISAQGLGSLTEEERSLLDRMSKRGAGRRR